jgi:hypothetical protein
MTNQIEESLAASLRSVHRRMEFWVANRERFLPLLAKVEELFPDRCQLDCGAISLDISIASRMGDLLGAIQLLEEHGYTPNNAPPDEEAVSTWHSYFECEGMPRIWFYWSNPFCTRVPVGTKMEEVTVYEVRCDG